MADASVRVEFIKQAIWHGSLERAQALLAAHPELASGDIHLAAILGDDEAVRQFLARDPAAVHAKSEPWGGDALTYLCLSKYLRLDPDRSSAFLRAAAALLDAGADVNGGFWTTGQFSEHETPLYGAAGVAHHADMTRLLLARGADPNDGEACYHSPENDDMAAFKVLVDTGKITPDNLSMMLLRKIDWHDYDGAKYVLDHGAEANRRWGNRSWTPLNHALARSNGLPTIELLLDRGADPLLADNGLSGLARAAREGRRDVLELLARRGVSIDEHLHGVDRVIAAAALDDTATIRTLSQSQQTLVDELLARGGDLLATFAGNGNVNGVRQLLDLGVPISAPFTHGDGYFDEPKGSLAIHIAAWRANHEVVKLLISRGSPLDTADAKGRTPLALAIKACVDSYWSYRRKPDSIAALLAAGAAVDGISFPTGYAEADDLLRAKFV